MGEKWDKDTTQGQKLIKLMSVFLSNPGKKYSTADLMDKLNCSKPRIRDYVAKLEGSGLSICEETGARGQISYWVEQPKLSRDMALSADDLRTLLLCRDIISDMLPDGMKESLEQSVVKTAALAPTDETRPDVYKSLFTRRGRGAVNVQEKDEVLVAVLKALDANKVLKICYNTPGSSEPRVHFAAPYRLMTKGDALFAQCWRLAEDDIPKDVYSMTLALQRVESAEIQGRTYKRKVKEQSGYFGIMDGELFLARVAFDASAAYFVEERTWSIEQKIEPQDDGGIVLEFMATSLPEVAAMVLGFGAAAQALAPPELVDTIVAALSGALERYKA